MSYISAEDILAHWPKEDAMAPCELRAAPLATVVHEKALEYSQREKLDPEFIFRLERTNVNQVWQDLYHRYRIQPLESTHSPLEYAAKKADLGLVEALLADGSIPVRRSLGTANDTLLAAVEGGSLAVLARLVAAWKSFVPEAMKFCADWRAQAQPTPSLGCAGARAVIAAVAAGREDMLRLLLENRAEVNFEDPRADVPQSALRLAISAHRYNPEITRLLVAAGADFNRVFDREPVFFSCRSGHVVRHLASLGCDFGSAPFLRATLNRRREGRRPGEWKTILEALAQLGVNDPSVWTESWPDQYLSVLREVGFADLAPVPVLETTDFTPAPA